MRTAELTRCKMGKLLDDMNEEDRTAVLNAFDNELWSTAAIYRVLRKEAQIDIGLTAIKEHRHGRCVCA